MTPVSPASSSNQTSSANTQTIAPPAVAMPSVLAPSASQQPVGFRSIPLNSLIAPTTIAAPSNALVLTTIAAPPSAPVLTTSAVAQSASTSLSRGHSTQGGGDRNPQPDVGAFSAFNFTRPPFVRDLLFNHTQWREADSVLLTQRFVNELSESVAWDAVVRYANQYLIDLPAGLRLSQVAVLQVLQIFLQCELRLAYTRYYHYCEDREASMVSMRATLGHVEYALELLIQRGEISGFSACLVKGLRGTIERVFGLALSPRDSARNMTRHTGTLPSFTPDDYREGPNGADASRGTYNSTLPAPGRRRGFVNVPGMPPAMTEPTDIGQCPEPYSEDLIGFFWNTCINAVHPKSKVNVQTGAPLTEAERKENQKRKGRTGGTAFTPSYFTDPHPERTKNSWVRDVSVPNHYQPSAEYEPTLSASGSVHGEESHALLTADDMRDTDFLAPGATGGSTTNGTSDGTTLTAQSGDPPVTLQTADLGQLMDLVNGLVSCGAVAWSQAESVFVPGAGMAHMNVPVDLSRFTVAFHATDEQVFSGATELGTQLLTVSHPAANSSSSSATATRPTQPQTTTTSASFRAIGNPVKVCARGTVVPVSSQPAAVRVSKTVSAPPRATKSPAKRNANGDPIFDERANTILGVQPVYVPRLFQSETATLVPPVLSPPVSEALVTSEHGSNSGDPPAPVSLVPRTETQNSEDLAWCLRWLEKAHFNDPAVLIDVLRGWDVPCIYYELYCAPVLRQAGPPLLWARR